jgi:cytochrome c6
MSLKKILFILIFITSFQSPVFADKKMELGLDVYNNKAMCGTCHALQTAGSSGDIGPNLDKLKPQIEQIIYAVTNGIGVMPPWGDILTPEEIEAVAYYVFTNTNK